MTHAEMAHVEAASRTATAWLPETEARAPIHPALFVIVPAIGLFTVAATLLISLV